MQNSWFYSNATKKTQKSKIIRRVLRQVNLRCGGKGGFYKYEKGRFHELEDTQATVAIGKFE